ncbi:MAG: glutamate--tRNA ligase [Patescibacteria group bacterium]|nr:glutamate--tRNA ligase [Patescibacteria group bacterium]
MNKKSIVRTRIAPSPTGNDLHIGNAYTALINYVFAKRHDGKFIIRIEDTDRTRYVEGSENKILESLAWLGISHDEGPDNSGPYAPYRQSERLEIYQRYAKELVEKGYAFYCFCTPQRLEQMRKYQEDHHMPPMYDGLCKRLNQEQIKNKIQNGESYVIRMNVPEEGTTTFTDLIRGEIAFENKFIDDQVLLKSDGYPTYHLGVVVDDHEMDISHVIRGEEWISSTPKHILLYRFFGWNPPAFAHLPVLRNPDKSKLSKRRNPVWVSFYRDEGFLPEAIKNYLALMAWSYPDGRDIFSLQDMIAVFDLQNIQTTAPIFDTEKLRWMNGQYIKRMNDEELTRRIYEFFHGEYDKERIASILHLVKERIRTLREFRNIAHFFFEPVTTFEKQLKKEYIHRLIEALETSDWKHDVMEVSIRKSAENLNIKPKELFMELRIAITGKSVGPPLLESLEIIGKEETVSRLKNILERV